MISSTSRGSGVPHLIAALALVAFVTTPALAQRMQQRPNDFLWNGRVEAGAWLTVRNIHGNITVDSVTGDKMEIRGTRRWRRGNPDDVRILVSRWGPNDENVLVCALWTPDAECDESGYRSRAGGGSRGDVVSVDFTIRLPRGVKAHVNTVNGTIRVTGATGEVHAAAVNGSLRLVSSGGPVTGSTVNGSIFARMGISGDGDLEYSTVNGSVDLEVPSPFNALLDFSTVNGSVESDFPLTVEGRLSPRRIRGTIGTGGRLLKVRTVNGALELRTAGRSAR